MSLLAIISTKEITSAKDVIYGSLQALPRDEQLSKLIDFFQVAADRDAQLAELISEAWNYLNANELWMVRYPSLQALKEDIDYDNALRLVLDRHQANYNRKRGQMRTILSNWKQLPDAALPSDLQPPVFSISFLAALAALSKICSIDVVIPLLRSAVDARKSTPQAHKYSFLSTGDISNVYKQLKTEPPLPPQPQPQLQSAHSGSQLPIDAQSAIRTQRDDEDQTPETIALQPEVLNSDNEGADEEKDVENSEENEAEEGGGRGGRGGGRGTR